MLESVPVGVDWSLVNEGASQWARDYSYNLVTGINATSQRAVGQAVSNFYTQQWSLADLKRKLGSIYSPVRAEMIAITEVTRAAVEGERATVREIAKEGIKMVEVWQTRNDEIVCTICGPRHGKKVGDGWSRNDGPPAHPRCRCWINHEFEKPVEEELTDVWQPSMTRDQAEFWARDSVFQEDFYHGTGTTERGIITPKDELERRIANITNEGFRVGPIGKGNGRMLGDGIYFADNIEQASRYGEIITTKLNVKNPWVGTMNDWRIQYNRINRQMKKEGLRLTSTGRINWWAENNGFDAIRITNTLQQVVVFDPKNITVIMK
jgi:hypothetical protein